MTDIITEPGIYRMRNGGRALITTLLKTVKFTLTK